jgi:hypothetical protein
VSVNTVLDDLKPIDFIGVVSRAPEATTAPAAARFDVKHIDSPVMTVDEERVRAAFSRLGSESPLH